MNIILSGFMGCGKTTIGKIIAQKLNLDFIDTDKLIEEREGRRIREIFDTDGEGYFRDKEHEICAELSREDNKVIATGGGALTFDRNKEVLSKNGRVIFIDVDLDTIIKRIGNDSRRPLLNSETRALFDRRNPIYKKNCDFTITVRGDVSAREIADNIIEYYIKGEKR
ncbi:MAG: shikimate kinase [Clostridia bacterium]|nr:shikimate kinase [Clostridia bacterium]MBQ5716275.1 shikimate kinase [Clostridia bacterium]